MKDSIKNLLKIKSIVTIAVLAMFIFGVITGKLGGEQIMTITSVVITFYFASKGGNNGNTVTNSELSNQSTWDYTDGFTN